jgi:hypothetical protein
MLNSTKIYITGMTLSLTSFFALTLYYANTDSFPLWPWALLVFGSFLMLISSIFRALILYNNYKNKKIFE